MDARLDAQRTDSTLHKQSTGWQARLSLSESRARVGVLLLIALTHTLAVLSSVSAATDTASYLEVARNFPDWNGSRLPLYPALMAVAAVLGDVRLAALVAVPLAVLGGWAVMNLTRSLNPRLTILAGVLVALNPASLTLAPLLLTDAIGGYLVAAFVWFAYDDLRKAKISRVTVVLIATMEFLRPPLALAGLFVVALALVVPHWKTALRLIALTIPIPLAICAANYFQNGVFTISFVSNSTFHAYLVARLESNFDAATMVTTQARYDAERAEYVSRYTDGTPEARAFRYDSEAIQQAVDKYGIPAVVGALLYEIRELLIATPTTNTPFIIVLFVERVAFLTLVIIGTGRLVKHRQRLTLPLLLIIGYFYVSSATSAWTGVRLRFPADLLMIPLAAYALLPLRAPSTKAHASADKGRVSGTFPTNPEEGVPNSGQEPAKLGQNGLRKVKKANIGYN